MDANRLKAEDAAGIWDPAGLPPNISFGDDCYLEINRANFERFRSTRDPGLRLGHRVRVYDWTCFNVEPLGAIDVGDDAVLAGTIFMCADRISIGRRVIVSYNVTIADCDFHPKDPALRLRDAVANAPFGDRGLRAPLEARPVVVEDDAWVGIGAIVLKGVRIGRGARIAAGAVVTADVPAGATVAGNPARIVPGAAAGGPDA